MTRCLNFMEDCPGLLWQALHKGTVENPISLLSEGKGDDALGGQCDGQLVAVDFPTL